MIPAWLYDAIVTFSGASILFGYMILLAIWDNRSCRRKQDDAPNETKKTILLRRR